MDKKLENDMETGEISGLFKFSGLKLALGGLGGPLVAYGLVV